MLCVNEYQEQRLGRQLFLIDEQRVVFNLKGLQDVLTNESSSLKMGANLFVFKINLLFFVVAWNMRNVNRYQKICFLFLKADEDEQDSDEVLFSFTIAFGWSGGCEKKLRLFFPWVRLVFDKFKED